MNNAHISIHSAARYLFSWLLVILLLITALPVVAQGPEQTGEPPGRTTEQGAEPTSTPVPALQEAPKRLKGLEEPLPPRTGFVPPPMDLSHLKGQRLLGQYVSAPASWDWRTSAVTPVKDQGACGSCYAFASIGNIESKLLIDSAGTWDFSENNAKECNWYETSGGGTSCSGGDYWQLASLFSKKGTVMESCDPYVASDVVSCNATCPYQKTLLVWRVISGETMPDTEVLKTYIQTYGPVYTSMYAGYYDAWDTEFSDYDGSYTLYYTGAEDPNHAVLIVGWDDSLTHAGGTGGWIVKNSWGTSWGGTCGYGTEGGYFTIAYGSASIGKYSSFMYDWQDYDTSGEIMYYDEGGWSTSWGCTGSTTAWGLVRFTPTSNTSVTRVEFWTADATTDVDVYIYDDFDGTAPSNLLAQKLNNSFNEAGYHSVALDTPLPITSGDDVVAVVKFTNDSSTLPTYPVVADAVGPSETGRTYFSCDGSAPWDDMGDSESDDVAIRLRTSAGGGGVGPVVYDSHTVDDDNSDESSGNDDGIVNPDETIELDVDLRNQGSDTATGVNATISTSDSYVTFLFNTSSSYGDIPGGGTGTNGDDFDFDVDPSTPDGHVICFDLDITSSNGGPWSDSFCVTVGGGAKTYLPIVLKNSIPGQLYFDDFSDPNSGWGVGDYSDYAHGYDSGNYYIQLKRDYWSAWAWPGFACADCTIEVEAWRCSGANSGYGIVFGLNSSGDQFYSFEVQPGNREYRLRRYDEGTWVTLISFTYSSYISSYNSHNRLKATREGSQIKLYVNGYYLTSYTDSTYTGSRYVGVHGRSGATSPVWLRYDDFTVWGSGYGTTSATEVGSGGVGMAPAPPD